MKKSINLTAILLLILVFNIAGAAANGKNSQPEVSPTKAALLSLVVPGAGQIYTKNFFHAAIFALSEAFVGYFAYDSYKKTEEIWRKRDSLVPGTPEYNFYGEEFEREVKTRNTYLWALAAIKFLDIVDAYVCAHLFTFRDELRRPLVRVLPAGDGLKLTVLIRF